MGKVLPIRAAALLVVAVFGFHLSRFYLVADLTDFVCPHHVQSVALAPPDSQGAMHHGDYAMPQSRESHTGTPPGKDGSGMRCCCRHSLDGLITTLTLFGPADLADAPVPDGTQVAALAPGSSVLQNDLDPPFIPPRV
jgi:hypothetical protein